MTIEYFAVKTANGVQYGELVSEKDGVCRLRRVTVEGSPYTQNKPGVDDLHVIFASREDMKPMRMNLHYGKLEAA